MTEVDNFWELIEDVSLSDCPLVQTGRAAHDSLFPLFPERDSCMTPLTVKEKVLHSSSRCHPGTQARPLMADRLVHAHQYDDENQQLQNAILRTNGHVCE
ncbi:MAG: hypothetical protein KatS3mg030_681 [Saprospiraceae bacterium]|nr:MAG: hypothetical protein KatS3mg030_681 [Saprospiraceae bacterium]